MVDSSPTPPHHHFDLDSGTPSSTFCSLLRPRDMFGRRGHRLISVVEMRPWWSLRPRSSSAFVVRSSLSGGVVRVAEPCARTPASPSPFWEGALACHLESALRLGDERRVPPFAGPVFSGGAPRGKNSGLFHFYAHFSRAAASRHAPRKRALHVSALWSVLGSVFHVGRRAACALVLHCSQPLGHTACQAC